MVKLLKILILLSLLPYSNQVQAQAFSNKGKEFWVGYGHHQFMETDNSQEMVLYFSAEEAAHVVVTIHGTTYREEYDVPANTVIPTKLIPKGLESVPATTIDARLYTKPPAYPGGTGSEGVFKKQGIHIESNVPIVAYAHIYGDVSSGATMLMPVETWGHSYISINTPQFYSSTYGSNFNCFSWMYVIAQHDNTRIQIVPTVNTRKGDPAGVPIVVTLQKGEIYQLLGAPIDKESGQNVAGSTVTSIANDQGECYPVGFFSGSSRTRINCLDAGLGSGDNIMQQGFPVQAWGKRYLTTPTSVDNSPKSRNINVFRIILRDPATVVKKNGMKLLALHTSNGYYYEYQSNTPDFIEADKPVLVAQYIPSANACGYIGAGDPEMILISPIEQSISRVGFYRNTKEKINVNFLSLIIPSDGVASLKIDGAQGEFDDVYAHPNYPGYSVVVKRWSAAQAQCIVESDSAFTAITYGLGGAESYGYNAGTYINNLNGFPGIKNEFSATQDDNSYTCVNTPVELSVFLRYKPTVLNWKISALAGTITPAEDVVQTNPVSSGTKLFNGVTYYRYSLPGYYRFDSAGTYLVPLLATSPLVETCNQTETVQYQVEVRPASVTGFDISYQDCSLLEDVRFTGNEKFDNGDNIYQWNWVFAPGDSAIGRIVSKEYTAGKYSVQLLAIDSAGCVSDTVNTFSLTAKPAIPEFKIVSTDSCAGATFVFEEASPETGPNNWYWDFGANDTLTVFDNSPISRQLLQHGTTLVKHVAKVNETCISDTATALQVVHPNPEAAFNMPGFVCMPPGSAQFTNASVIADGSSLGYTWFFGDGTPPNYNKDPLHTFSKAGNYTVSLTVTSSQGCLSKVSQVFSNFLEKPLASFNISEEKVCLGTTIRFEDGSSAPGSNINSWSWYFGDGSQSNMKEPSKLYLAPGNYGIKLVVKNTEGCVSDTATGLVQVYPQPVIDAGPSFVVKEGTEVILQATSNGEQFTFRWSPATGLNNPNILQPTLTATTDGVYTLTATGENNCTASDYLTVTVQRGIVVPNAFSPNGDGINDVWKIRNIELYQDAGIDVFDRYGGIIYRANGSTRPWDGTIKGKPAPVGTYYYIINLKDGSAVQKGIVTILR